MRESEEEWEEVSIKTCVGDGVFVVSRGVFLLSKRALHYETDVRPMLGLYLLQNQTCVGRPKYAFTENIR